MELRSPAGVSYIAGENELELLEAHRKIVSNESRLRLMETLLNMGLCTRDIYSFVCSQADLCESIVEPDRNTINSAMKIKIRDLKQTL